MRKFLSGLLAVFAVFSVSARVQWMMGSNTFNVDTLYHVTSGPGMTTTSLLMQGADSNVNTLKENVFVTTVDLTNPNLEFRAVQGKDYPGKVETVTSMGTRKTAEGKGVYLAGVNSDYFNMGYDPTRGAVNSIVDRYYTNNTGYGADWEAYAPYMTVRAGKDVRIVDEVVVTNTLTLPNGNSTIVHVNPPGRNTNDLCLYSYHRKKTETNEYGTERTLKLVSGSDLGDEAVFEVTGQAVTNVDPIPDKAYVLSGHGTAATFVSSLKIGDRLTKKMTILIDGEPSDIDHAVGGIPMLIRDGEMYTEFGLDPGHFKTNRSRTAIGYNKDRTKLLFVVVDETNGSKGFAMHRVAQLMKNLGCHNAMAFDGGGSTTLYNHKYGTRNVPTGITYLRPVVNAFFAVSTCPVDENIAFIEVQQKNVKLSSGGTFTPTVVGFNKYGVVVNTNVTNFTLSVASSLGSVSGKTFTAGSAKGVTRAVVTCGNAKAGVVIYVNGGGKYVTSGNDAAPVMVKAPYTPDKPLGNDVIDATLTERWRNVKDGAVDNWEVKAPSWTTPDAIMPNSNNRYATAFNGRFYTLDMKTMAVSEISRQGELQPAYRLPVLNGRKNGVRDYYGTAVSSDDHGHFLIGHYFTKATSATVWTIYDPKTGLAKNFELPNPTNYGYKRMDCVGRVVGDLTKEAYFYVFPGYDATSGMKHRVSIVRIKTEPGFANFDVTCTLSPEIWMSNQTASFAQPICAIDDMESLPLSDTFIAYSKAAGFTKYSQSMYRYSNGVVSPNLVANFKNYAATGGFDTFTLKGQRFYVLNYVSEAESATNANPMDIVILDKSFNVVASWKNPDFKSNYGYSTVVARKVDDTNVNIYVYNFTGNRAATGTGAISTAMLRFSADADGGPADDTDVVLDYTPTGIDDIIADGDYSDFDAEPVYYNLQGVQVSNPSAGIYIVRRGNRVTKEFIP